MQPDGKALVAGTATASGNADGTIDGTFTHATRAAVSPLQPDGKILLGGGFSQVNGQRPATSRA